MSSIAFDEAIAAYDALDAALERIEGLDLDALSTPQRMALLERNQTAQRRLPALQHELINELAACGTVEELGASLARALADRLRIRPGEATRRIAEAAELAPRRALTGQPLPPRLEHTAAAQRAGAIGAEHVKVIRAFFAQLPGFIDEPRRADAERVLARLATAYRPDQLKGLAAHLELVLNPDGNFCDDDRARRRGVSVGPQGSDGMSRLSGWLTPELRAGLDAVLAKWAAPGMCNPADEQPTTEGTPPAEAIDADARSAPQRTHDALNAMVRATLMSGELGSHRGLPVTIVATAKLEDLRAKTGMARTGGGTLLPVKEVIRMAAHAHNYLLVFDKARRCQLYKGRDSRLATPAQRLVLYALERGCTRPGCDVPAYWCQVHHAKKDFAKGGRTDIDGLTLACGPDNRLATDGGWTTRKNDKGETEWIPPPHLDRGQPRTNTYFHPEKMLPDDNEDDDA
jgi:Domain of unknown function (DUF222)